jgi:hypothetical protein
MDSLKITDMMNKSKNTNKKEPPVKQSLKQIPMLSIRDIIITSSSMGIPWLVLLILAAILIFI